MNPNEHPAELLLERFSVDDLQATARASVDSHVRSCIPCRQKLEAISDLSRERMRMSPPTSFVDRVEARHFADRRKKRFVALAACGLAAGFIISLFLVRPTDRVRLKGSSVVLYQRRDNATTVLGGSASIAPKDALEVAVVSADRVHVQAWFVDSAGEITQVSPSGPVDLEPGEHVLHGESLIVEAPCRDLVLVVAFGEQADRIREADLLQRLDERDGIFVQRLRCR